METMNTEASTGRGTVGDVVARIERMPISTWHLKARFIIGIATFFDGFDAIAIAYVLPVIGPQWHLTPSQIGLLLSASFGGQILAALFFGWWAERYGRMPAIIWSTIIYSAMSLACAFAWDFWSLLALRTLQGIGIGGEVPVAMTYLAELSRTRGRGRFLLLYELVFPVGLVAAVLVGAWLVPNLGWQSLFVVGAFPALIVFFMQRLLPESPRWLATHGRYAEADAVLTTIEKSTERSTKRSLPPPQLVVTAQERSASFADLFGPQYLKRTLTSWAIWSCCYFCTFGLATWLPSIYRSVFQLSVSDALSYSVVTQVVGLGGCLVCALSIDLVRRGTWFAMAFTGAAATFLWLWGANPSSPTTVMIAGSLAYFFINFISIGVYLYTPEIYPTRVRAIGLSASACWARIASFVGPNVIGALMGAWGLSSVFLGFAVAAFLGAIVAVLFVTETRFKVLEEISP
jgi:MFS transporter, putative metabolite:H+ symporter